MANNSDNFSKSVVSSGSSVSLNGKVWQMPLQNKEVYSHLKKCGKSEFLANIIACNARLNGFERKEEYNQFYSAPASGGGISDIAGVDASVEDASSAFNKIDVGIENFLNPKIKQLMPSPFELMDMEKAAKHIIDCIKNKSKIALFSDYDVDGAVSAAVLIKFLRLFHVEPITYIPDRIEEGYGPNVKAFAKLKESGVKTIITLDCGIVAFESIDYAKNNGLDVIVVDHHKGGASNPNATAVVNPNRCDETSELGYICGATVAFMLCTAIYMILNRNENENVDKDCFAFDIMQNGIMQSVAANKVSIDDLKSSASKGFASEESLSAGFGSKKLNSNNSFDNNISLSLGGDVPRGTFKNASGSVGVSNVGGNNDDEVVGNGGDGGEIGDNNGKRNNGKRNETQDSIINNDLNGVINIGKIGTNVKHNGDDSHYNIVNISEIRQSLTDMLDLVALATVCDVVPLIKLNRALANTGISLMNNTKNIGIREMLLQTGFNFKNEKITARTLGFTLGPIINAGGRIGNSALAAHLLSTNNIDDAKKTAAELIGFNIKRREIEQEITDEAIQRCALSQYGGSRGVGAINVINGDVPRGTFKNASGSVGVSNVGGNNDDEVVGNGVIGKTNRQNLLNDNDVFSNIVIDGAVGVSELDNVVGSGGDGGEIGDNKLFVFEYSRKWHPGIIGIVASRVKDRYSRLSIIGSLNVCDGKEFITASCRSIPAIDIGSIVIAGVESGILQKGGGHAAAAGFTLELSKVEEFIVFVNNKIREIGKRKNIKLGDISGDIKLDGDIAEDITKDIGDSDDNNVSLSLGDDVPRGTFKNASGAVGTSNIIGVSELDNVVGSGGDGGAGNEVDSNNSFDPYCDDISTVKTLHVDAALSIKSLLSDGLWNDMKILEPFGCQNEEPVFLFKKLTLKSANIVKEKHLRLFFRCDASDDVVNAMMFGKIGTKLGDTVKGGVGRVFDIVGTISNDPKWNKISITVIDALVY